MPATDTQTVSMGLNTDPSLYHGSLVSTVENRKAVFLNEIQCTSDLERKANCTLFVETSGAFNSTFCKGENKDLLTPTIKYLAVIYFKSNVIYVP